MSAPWLNVISLSGSLKGWVCFGTISLNSAFLFHPDGISEMTKMEKLLK
jgi:hypothetical protein